jgi:hypothetical protein
MEKVSGLELKWYMSYWINTTKKIDYGIRNVVASEENTLVTLERVGEFPMPIDLVVTYKDGSTKMIYIPLNEMLGKKPIEDSKVPRKDNDAWPWVNPTYVVQVDGPLSGIKSIEIDPSLRMADVERKNNKVVLGGDLVPYKQVVK